MGKKLFVTRILICNAIALAVIPARARAEAPVIEVPLGFYLVTSNDGVALYRKDYPGGNPDFVQVVDMSLGAYMVPLHGGIAEHRQGEGLYGGDDPRITTRALSHYWDIANAASESAFCVSNGQFFLLSESPTRLPFALKIDGTITSDGYERNDHQDEKLMLELWAGEADIRPLSGEALYSSSAPDIIAGLVEDGRKSPTKYVPRTFVGIGDRDMNGSFETVYMFNTKTARQSDAAQVLRDFGAEKVMMLDGGGSTQLMCEGNSIIKSDRKIPQAMAVFAGDSTRVASSSVENSSDQGLFGFSLAPEEQSTPSLQTAGITGSLVDLRWILLTMLAIAGVMAIAVNRSRQQYY